MVGHTGLQMFYVFFAVHGVWLPQGLHMASKYSGKTHLKIFPGRLSKIGPMGTLIKSQGTKNLVSKIFSYHPHMMLFYTFCGFV